MPANISHNDMLCDQCFTPVRGYPYNVITECDENGKKTDETYRHKYCHQVPAELREANANDGMRDEHYRRRKSLMTAERDEGLWRAYNNSSDFGQAAAEAAASGGAAA